MMLIFQNNIKVALWITDLQQISQKLIHRQMIFYNSIKQKMIMGSETKVYGEPIDTFLPKWRDMTKQSSDDIFKLFEQGSSNAYPKLEEFLTQNSNSSLCDFTSVLKTRKELCNLLDNKIPLRGIVQVYFRVTQYLDEALEHLAKKAENAKILANDHEFVEFEYTFENIYYKTFLFIEHEVHEYLEVYVFEQVHEAINLIISLMIAFIVISFFFTIFSFRNIIIQINRVSFTFQLLSMDTVINNTGVKFRFLKVYRLNQKHF